MIRRPMASGTVRQLRASGSQLVLNLAAGEMHEAYIRDEQELYVWLTPGHLGRVVSVSMRHRTVHSDSWWRSPEAPSQGKLWEPGCLVEGKGARGEEDWGVGRKVRHELGHEWHGWIMEGVSARVGLLGWGRAGDGLGTGAHRGGGGLPFRSCFGPTMLARPRPRPRRPAPAPPGPATPFADPVRP